MLFRATVINLELLFALLFLGLLVGTVVALLQVYGGRIFGTLAATYAWIFRSIPALVLLFLFYFGPSQFGVDIAPFLAATLALGLRSSAYQSQIFRGAIQAIPGGQMMAARSMGMSRVKAISSIILPQAFRLSIPGWSNEFSSVVKDTTLAYVVGLNEVLRHARIIMDRHYDLAMLAYLSVALIFLVLTYTGNRSLGWLEMHTRIPGVQMSGEIKGGK
jgi:polar amino acid transport system permease protein